MKKILSYLIPTLICLGFSLLIVISKNIFRVSSIKQIMQIVCDGCFAPGVIILCIGLLIWASNEGTFDMLAYGITKIFDVFRKDMSKVKYKTFYDYRVAKQDEKKSFSHLVLVGIIFCGISFVFLMIYYNC